ncbi:unnamed protein product [Bursaphelenchus xylophilus]|uniref:(pine wood nematode) hypothetical protein n=1 Tax=Bursaphelenchus xylophilus TaxID=6326 RepID=A0A1I7RQN3_BURXY|nr:unnamed protein product [Bursaphelenchus xylophilus]CAG9104857.1 unnamed protein product [Bursaphelenchus xylophilus]
MAVVLVCFCLLLLIVSASTVEVEEVNQIIQTPVNRLEYADVSCLDRWKRHPQSTQSPMSISTTKIHRTNHRSTLRPSTIRKFEIPEENMENLWWYRENMAVTMTVTVEE